MIILRNILLFLLIFSVIVIGHEYGHYAVAKRCGIRCYEFDIGFGPAVLRKKGKITDFVIRLLPFGGACVFTDLKDMNPDGTIQQTEQERKDDGLMEFKDAGPWARFATMFAGPFSNFLIGIVICVNVVCFTGIDLPVIGSVVSGSAAEKAGLKAGDVITEINGHRVNMFRDISLDIITDSDSQLNVTYKRDGQENTVIVTPVYDEEYGRMMVGISGSAAHKCNAWEVFRYGFLEACYYLRSTYASIGIMLRGNFSMDDISGPIGIVKMVGDTYDSAESLGAITVVMSLLNLASFLSVNLFVVNLLPLPALDGGQILLCICEIISGKRIPQKIEGIINTVGLAGLAGVALLVFINDIGKYF